VQLYGGARFFVESQGFTGVVRSVDARNIDQHIDQLRADFVVLHLYGVLVRSDVDVGDHVEEEGLLDLALAHELVHQLDNVLHLREHLLNNPGERLVDSQVVDTRHVVLELDLILAVAAFAHSELGQEPAHVLGNLVERLELLLVLHEHVGVNFVDKHFEGDRGVHLIGDLHDLQQFVAGLVLVGFVRVDHEDERPALLESSNVGGVRLVELFGAWVVLDLEVDVGVVVDL